MWYVKLKKILKYDILFVVKKGVVTHLWDYMRHDDF